MCCCTSSCPLCPGQGRTGLGAQRCPCTARRGSASAPCLCRWLYEGVSRQKAEELLLQPGNRSGSFLIRESQTRQGESPRAPTPVPPPSHAPWHGHQGGHGAGYGPSLHGPQKWRLGHRATAPDVLLRSSHVLALPHPLVWKCSWCGAGTGVLTACSPIGRRVLPATPMGQ